jgi:hypothetical protein
MGTCLVGWQNAGRPCWKDYAKATDVILEDNTMADGNIDNLRSIGDRTTEEQRAITTAGGIASGKTRRRQKTLREMFETFGESKPNKVVVDQFEKLGIPVEDDDTMLTCMFKWAGVKSVAKGTKMGDLLKFFEVFGKYTGQEPAQKHELTGADGKPLNPALAVNLDLVKEMENHLDKQVSTDN